MNTWLRAQQQQELDSALTQALCQVNSAIMMLYVCVERIWIVKEDFKSFSHRCPELLRDALGFCLSDFTQLWACFEGFFGCKIRPSSGKLSWIKHQSIGVESNCSNTYWTTACYRSLHSRCLIHNLIMLVRFYKLNKQLSLNTSDHVCIVSSVY